MVGSVVASAADSFWSFLRVDPDDVFADKLKKKVLEAGTPAGRASAAGLPTIVQASHNDKNAPTLSMCGGVWAIFVWD
jgi:hypothetical protein